MIGVVAFGVVFYETKCCYGGVHAKGNLALLELVRFVMMISKYFFLLMLGFCTLIMSINNLIYLVILGRVLIVVFVTSILMGSLTNSFVPYVMIVVSRKGGLIFMVMMVVLLFL